MEAVIEQIDQLSELCAATDTDTGLNELLAGIIRLFPDADFQCVLSRGGWHRPGGVVDADYQSVSDNIMQWAETVSGGDVDTLIADYQESGYFATRMAGKTHYFTAPYIHFYQ